MAYRLRHEETVGDAVRRIVHERIDHAVACLTDPCGDRDEAIHEARKDCKKIRAVLRLVRGAMPATWRFEHDWFRDAAGTVSHLRDAQVVVETHDMLVQELESQQADSYDALRRALFERRDRLVDDADDADRRIERFLDDLRAVRHRVTAWELETEGFAAVEGGLRRNYARARKAMHHAWIAPSPASFHEWRKPVKYFWYHCRLLEPLWPALIAVYRDCADTLGDLLGNDHDLAVLHDIVSERPGAYGGQRVVADYARLIDGRRAELQATCRPLGERLLAEKAGRLVERFAAYWDTWQRAGAA